MTPDADAVNTFSGEFPIEVTKDEPSFLVDFSTDYSQVRSRSGGEVAVPAAVVDQLRAACKSVSTEDAVRVESSRDWWPLGMHWTRAGEVGGLAGVVARASTPEHVAAVLRVCNDARIPVTVAGGRSGCVGGTIPLFGGVLLDVCDLKGIVDVDTTSGVVDVASGTFGDLFEQELRETHGVTLGHWPQSINLSTVGGWLACRGAGQMSNRYGKIEDMVVGLDVALADGTTIQTGGATRSATGPDLNQLFVGSEGTLGVITGARLRVHPAPAYERRAAFGFPSFEAGLEATRRICRRGLSPAVLRLYDQHESNWKFQTGPDHALLLVLDEGDPHVVDAAMAITAEVCADATVLDTELVEAWMGERNDVSGIPDLLDKGIVYDTIEVTGRWRDLPGIYQRTVSAMKGVEGTLAASSHQSHGYLDGACLYFTFAGLPSEDAKQDYYNQVWDVGTRAILAAGGNLSHHHGVGLNRARFMREALGPAFDTFAAVKAALDPNGILNPGKLGLPSPFGTAEFP